MGCKWIPSAQTIQDLDKSMVCQSLPAESGRVIAPEVP
jgi:hypothetical protein